MKKLGILCALLLITAITAMAQDAVDLFSDIDAVALSGEEMKAVVGEGPAKMLRSGDVNSTEINEMRSDRRIQDRIEQHVQERKQREIETGLKIKHVVKGAAKGLVEGLVAIKDFPGWLLDKAGKAIDNW